MSNLKILLKNNLNILLGRLQGKKKRTSTGTALALLILGMVGLFALYSFQSWTMFEGLGSLGLGKLCVFHGVITTLTVLIIIGIMRVTGKSTENDADLLLSLPLKKREIIISKLINKYLFDLFFAFVLLIPYIVFYEITAPVFSAKVLIFGIITTFTLPLMSVGTSQIMEFIVVTLFNKTKYANLLKSLIPTAIYIVLIVFMMIKTSGYGAVQFESMEAYFQDRFFSNQILTFIFNQTLLSILVFVGITIVPATIGIILKVYIFGKNFGIYTSNSKKIELNKRQKPLTHLLKKEIRTYFFTPSYLINTIIGPIFIIVLSIVFAIFGVDGLKNLLQVSISNTNLTYIFAVILNFMISMTCISCVSISLEGKTIWLIHSLPISINQIFISKLIVSLIVVVPAIFVSAVIFGIATSSIMSVIIIFFVSLLFLLINDVSGLMINLWFPKFNWEDEIQVVKQSLSVLLAMVFNWIIAVIPIAIFLIFDLSINTVALITLILYLVCLITFTSLLFTTGKKLFRNMRE